MSEDQNRSLNDKFMLRLPDGMRDRIKDAAAKGNRSMNAEIIGTLELAYPDERPEKKFLESMTEAFKYLSTIDPEKRAILEEEVQKQMARNAIQRARNATLPTPEDDT